MHMHTLMLADEVYPEMANGRVLMVELYTHRNQNLIFMHLFTEMFSKDISPRFRKREERIIVSINSALILRSGEVSLRNNSVNSCSKLTSDFYVY